MGLWSPGMPQAPDGSELARELRGLETCRLESADASKLALRGRTSARSPLVFCPLVGATALLPWLGPVPITELRIAVSAVLAALCLLLVRMSWPRCRRYELNTATRTLARGARVARWGDEAHFALRLAPQEFAPQCRYAICLVEEGQPELEVLSGPWPDRLLRELHDCRRHLPLPVATGWGLPASAQPWDFADPRPDRGPEPSHTRPSFRERVVITALRSDPGLIRVLPLLAAGAIVALAYLVVSRWPRDFPPHPLSILLPAAMAAYLVFVARSSTRRTEIHLSDDSTFRVPSSSQHRGPIPARALRATHLVGRVDGVDGCHLLLDTQLGPIATPVRIESAEGLLRQLQSRLPLDTSDVGAARMPPAQASDES